MIQLVIQYFLAQVVRPRFCWQRFCLSVRQLHSWATPKRFKISKYFAQQNSKYHERWCAAQV